MHSSMRDNMQTPEVKRTAFDFGYGLYVHIRKIFYGGILAGFLSAVCLYPLFQIHSHSTWRPYFYYGPLAIGLSFAGIFSLVAHLIFPRESQVNFEAVLTSVEKWRELDARNKARLLVGAIFALGSGLVIGWVVGGWAGFVFR